MEGNDCYKLTTIRNYIEKTGAPPIRVAVDIGCNVADVTLLMRFYFPESRVFAFEPVEEYYQIAARRMANDVAVQVIRAAVCGLHKYEDDLGEQLRPTATNMKILKAREGSMSGWKGSSWVVAESQQTDCPASHTRLVESVHPISLDEVLALTRLLTGLPEIDYVKLDCEGCECDALGCASAETLKSIRFMSGEYHYLDRFYHVMTEKLYDTHYVNLNGDKLGAFFCERIGEPATILSPSREGMFLVRPWMCEQAIDWHPFQEEFVLPYERAAHGL